MLNYLTEGRQYNFYMLSVWKAFYINLKGGCKEMKETINELFETQVKKTPNNIAVIYKTEKSLQKSMILLIILLCCHLTNFTLI